MNEMLFSLNRLFRFCSREYYGCCCCCWSIHSCKLRSFASGISFNPTSPLNSVSFCTKYVENDGSNDREMGFKESWRWDNHSNNIVGNEEKLAELSGSEELDNEGEENDGSDADNDFRVVESYNGIQTQTEDVLRRALDGIEEELRHPLVKEICRLMDHRSAWNPKLEWQLRRLLRSLHPVQVCAVLRSQSDERVALQFFYWADKQWRYRHDPLVYYAMLEILSKTKLCQGAKRILRLMRKRKVECWPEAFGYVMVSFSRAGHLRKALQMLTALQKAGIQPNLSICNTAIYVLVKGNQLERAFRFLERMRAVGITPNVITYNCLIKGYCDVHRIEDAVGLIGKMPSRGCFPDKVSYCIVMAFLCKEKRIDEVKELMEKMQEDSNLIPDQVTYANAIHALSRHGHADEAWEFLKEAEGKGFNVDKVGHSAVINSFCQKGNLEKAKELLNEMFAKDCIPDVVTYTAVVNGFCHIGDIDQAKKLLQQMYKHGIKPNTVSYTALLHGLCKIGKSSEAREMMNKSEEGWWTPNAITYSVLVHGFRREGKLLEACDLAREMIKEGFLPNTVEINLLIQSLCQEGKTNDAKKFMEECLHKGCAVNVVNFTTVIHGFCQRDDLDEALSILDDIYLNNKHPDVVTYTALIDALGMKGRINEAAELAKKMLHKGLIPDPVTYRVIIHRFCQHGRVDDLLILLEKMLKRQKCRTVYNQVIEKLCSFGKLDEAYKLLGNVLRTASRMDANTCNILMDSYLKKGDPLLSYKVACRMFKRNLIPDLKLCEKVSKKLLLEGKVNESDKLMLLFVERGHISPQL